MSTDDSSYVNDLTTSDLIYTTLIDNSPFYPDAFAHSINNTSATYEAFNANFSKFLSSQANQEIINVLQQETSLIWIVFGTIGNLLSLFVLLRRKMRIHSTFTYLTLLALCDTFVLYFGLLRDYLVSKYKYDVSGDLMCKFHVFSFYFVLHMASWLLVAVNIDRLIAASFLSLSKKWCTPRTALKVSLYLAISLILLNSHFIYYVDSPTKQIPVNEIPQTKKIINEKNQSKNNNNSEYSYSNSVNLSLKRSKVANENSNLFDFDSDQFQNSPNDKDLSLFSTFVSSKLTIEDENATNAGLLELEWPINPYVYQRCLIKANNPQYSYFFQRIFTWIDASAQVILPFIIMVICNVNIIHKVLLTKNKTNGKNLKRLRKIKGMCIMIVSVSVIFFILEAPVLILICLMQGEYIKPEWPYIELVWTVVNLMMYTNHVINFISYCMTGTKFRRELLRLLCVHKVLKFLSSYKNLNFLTTTNLNATNNQHNLTMKLNQLNAVRTEFVEAENQMVNVKLKETKVNFVAEPILIKNNAEKIIITEKPVSLTNRIINQKNLLGESAVRKSRLSFLKKKLSRENDWENESSKFSNEDESFGNLENSSYLIEKADGEQRKDQTKKLIKSIAKMTVRF